MTEASNPKGRFGTFEGVFVPCVLTILGVIMFMRSGFVVGHVGLWTGLTILALSKLITTLTTVSLSAISTNTEVRGGGVYYMISRSLGADFGGTIGITLYIAQAVGVSFYIIGFTEAFLETFSFVYSFIGSVDQSPYEVLLSYKVPQMISSVVVAGLFYLTFKGADLALKVQNYVLGLLLLSILSFIVGGFLDFDPERFEASKKASESAIGFGLAFAIFFPAATGITAGANMSGDLKNPERSIPWGTFMAIAFTIVIYVLQFFLMAGASDREALQASPFESLQNMSVFSPLVSLGVFAATLSSALGSFLGAPRILQAMGKDGLVGAFRFFAKGEGASDEPQRATALTFVIALLVIWAGDLNAVAEVISMFFLIAYGTINLSAFVESKGGNPSFRPNFKFFHWSAALAGAIGCTLAMMIINDFYAILALFISSIIFYYLKRQKITTIEDAKRGFIFNSIRDNLNLIEGAPVDPKNWRPVLVAITGDVHKQKDLIKAGSWLESERGLYTVLNLDARPSETYLGRIESRDIALKEMKQVLQEQKVKAFSEALIPKDFHEGLFNYLQCHSIGALKANSIILEIPDQESETDWPLFLEKIEIVASFNQNLILYKKAKLNLQKRSKQIDIWWGGETNGSLMILFAYLVSLNDDWSGAKIRLLRIQREHETRQALTEKMGTLVRKARIAAEIKIVPHSENEHESIRSISSYDADLVFLGMGATDGNEAKASIEKVLPLLNELPTTFLVWSNGEANILA